MIVVITVAQLVTYLIHFEITLSPLTIAATATPSNHSFVITPIAVILLATPTASVID